MANQERRGILLVDDDLDSLRNCKAVLERAGYRVAVFETAAAALAALRDGLKIDAVVTDYRMPDMDGMAFLEILRREWPSVPVIMLTAHGDIDTYFRSFSLGLFEYLNKPFHEAELIRVVRTAVGDAGPGGRGKPAQH